MADNKNAARRTRPYKRIILLLAVGVLIGLAFSLHRAPIIKHRPLQENTSTTGDYLAGYYAIKNDDMEEASALFAKTLRQQPHSMKVLKSAYLTTLLSGNVEKAIELAKKYTKGNPEAITGYLVLGVDAIYKHNFTGAEAIFTGQAKKSASSRNEDSTIIPYMLSWCYVGAGDYAKAITTLKKLQQDTRDPDNSFLLYQLALIYDLSGDTKEAETAYSKLLDNGENAYRYLKAVGNFYERTGNIEKARKIYLSYLGREPLSDLFRTDLIRLDKKHTAPARNVNDAAHGAIEVLLEIASGLYKAGMLHEAQAYLQMILYLDPAFTHAHVLLAATYEDTKHYELAIGHYENITPDSDFYRQAQINIAQDYYKLGKTALAKERLTTLAHEEKNDYLSLMALGELLRSESAYLQAAGTYSKVIDSFKGNYKPYHWIVFYMRGMNYERANQWDKAEADLQQALKIKPHQPDVLNYLGYSWLTLGKNLPEALQMIRTAQAARPDDAQILDSLGWALFVNNNPEGAVPYVERALEAMPADPTINEHLGDIYWKLGRQIEARFQWQHALGNGPEAKDQKRLEQKIENEMPEITAAPAPAVSAPDKAAAKPAKNR